MLTTLYNEMNRHDEKDLSIYLIHHDACELWLSISRRKEEFASSVVGFKFRRADVVGFFDHFQGRA